MCIFLAHYRIVGRGMSEHRLGVNDLSGGQLSTAASCRSTTPTHRHAALDRIETPPITNPALADSVRLLVEKLSRLELRPDSRRGQLSASKARMLQHLQSHGPADVSALARWQGLRNQSAGASIRSLAKAGLIRRESDPTDGRRVICSLTEQGRCVVVDLSGAADVLVQRLSHASADERKSIAVALGLLQRVLS